MLYVARLARWRIESLYTVALRYGVCGVADAIGEALAQCARLRKMR